MAPASLSNTLCLYSLQEDIQPYFEAYTCLARMMEESPYRVSDHNYSRTSKLGAGILVLVERLTLLGGFNSIGKAYSVPFSLAVVESLAAFRSPLVRRFHCIAIASTKLTVASHVSYCRSIIDSVLVM